MSRREANAVASRTGEVWRYAGVGSFAFVVLRSSVDYDTYTCRNGTLHQVLVMQDGTVHSDACPYVTLIREYESWNGVDTMYRRIA